MNTFRFSDGRVVDLGPLPPERNAEGRVHAHGSDLHASYLASLVPYRAHMKAGRWHDAAEAWKNCAALYAAYHASARAAGVEPLEP